MNVELLIATMNLKNKAKQEKSSNTSSYSLIINQITDTNNPFIESLDTKNRCLSFYERGLSKSRNHALKNAVGDICTLSDDDMKYVDDYEKLILDGYKKYPDADIIAFSFKYPNGNERKRLPINKKIGFLYSMKINSAMITFRRKRILENDIWFDTDFGAGSKYPWGEENIFLFDCLRKGLKIYYMPVIIGQLNYSESSWSKDNTSEHYEHLGSIYYRMSSTFYWLLIIQFAIRKRNIYKNDLTFSQIIFSMFNGAKKYKNSRKGG